jgi:hypothetical protein
MNVFAKVAIGLFLSVSFTALCFGEAPKVDKIEKSDGWYIQDHKEFKYYADTKAKICYVVFMKVSAGVGGGVCVIDSEKLKNREEWKSIITW